MATTVTLAVTATVPVDVDRYDYVLPAELAALLIEADQPLEHGLQRHGSGPWRYDFHLSGPDRLTHGQMLEARLRAAGYEADLCV